MSILYSSFLLAALVKSADFPGGKSELNPNGWQSHFPWSGDNKNYIRGDTILTGHLDAKSSVISAKNLSTEAISTTTLSTGSLKTGTIDSDKLCIGTVCMTAEQLAKVLQLAERKACKV